MRDVKIQRRSKAISRHVASAAQQRARVTVLKAMRAETLTERAELLRESVKSLVTDNWGPDSLIATRQEGRVHVAWTGHTTGERVIDALMNLTPEDAKVESLM